MDVHFVRFFDSVVAIWRLRGEHDASRRVRGYRLLPTETDLNSSPSHGVQFDEFLPVTSSHETSGLCNAWEGGYLMQPLARKCESLAVSAVTGRYSDDIDVVARVDILKQIFKTPYSKSRLSVAMHRVGHTLILNAG